jgi:hypothetical protein
MCQLRFLMLAEPEVQPEHLSAWGVSLLVCVQGKTSEQFWELYKLCE